MRTTLHITYEQSSLRSEPVPAVFCHWNDSLAAMFPNKIYVGSIEADLPAPPPRSELVKTQIAALRKEQAKHTHAADLIEEEIGRLLAIEDKS